MASEAKDDNEISQRLHKIENQLDRLAAQTAGVYSVAQENLADEIDLGEIGSVLWKGKWIIVLVTALISVLSVWYALSLPNIYESKATLAPTPEAQSGRLRGSGQLSGLASLAGVAIPSQGVDKVATAIEILRSRQFITQFIRRHELLPELIAVAEWNWSENRVLYDPNIYDSDRGEWVRNVSFPRTRIPSDVEAYKRFMEGYSVAQDRDTGFVTISIEHMSPYLAQQWIGLLIADINSHMKHSDVSEAERSIDYLHRQMEATALADMRRVFYQLIEEQTKTIMLAAVRDEYIFTTIDPPVVSEERSSPNRSIICILGFIFGGVLSVIVVFVIDFKKKLMQAE